MQPIHIGNPKKCIGHPGPLRLVGLKMKPHAIPSDAEIAWVRLRRIRWVGEHLLKSQDSTVIVFGSGRIRNCNDRNGAGDHRIGRGRGSRGLTMTFTCPQGATSDELEKAYLPAGSSEAFGSASSS